MSHRVPLLAEESGIRHDWVDNGDGTYSVVSSQDVEGILDRNRALANHNDGFNKARDMRRIGEIPNIVLMQWMTELRGPDGTRMSADEAKRIMNSHAFLKRKLDDSDNEYLRSVHFKRGM